VVNLQGGDWYEERVHKKIVGALGKTLTRDGRMHRNCIGTLDKVDEDGREYLAQEFWDDISGKALAPESVRKARALEVQYISDHEVYVKVPVSMCWERTGKKPIAVRRVDVNKGDAVNEEIRSRLVAQEIALGKRDDLFAATPPLEAKKAFYSMAVTKGIGWGTGSEPLKIEFIDISRAFFHADARREVFVDLPPEDSEEGMCGMLKKSLYGTRDAPQNWEFEYCSFMKELGFSSGKASPCVFYHEPRNLRCVVHGDDFTLLGSKVGFDLCSEPI
jgi:hypothetical protein